jgi:hypothetical protein
MDGFSGEMRSPLTLNKYIYGNDSPANMVDPSGNFSMGSLAISSSIVGGLSGGVVGGIRGGWKGAVYGAAFGAAIAPMVATGVVASGPYVGAALGVSTGTGIFISGATANLLFSAAEVRNLYTAESKREVIASTVALTISAAAGFLGARAYYGVRAGRGTFTNQNPDASAEEIAAGKWLANTLRADIVAKIPTGPRGPGTADYFVAFQGKTLELKNMTGSTSERNVVNKILDAQGQNVVVVLKPGQFGGREANIAGRVFGAGTSKKSVQFVYETDNGYVAGDTYSR